MNSAKPTYNDLFADAFARYLAVRPSGLQMPYGPIVRSLSVRLLAFSPARTLYENRHPRCRSLDGIQSLTERLSAGSGTARAGRPCASCRLRQNCTPQIYLQLLHDRVPYRLLLAYSSARNFMLFLSRLRQQGRPIENAEVILSVLDRGRWGELRFISPPPPQPPP